mmetsp:Transcript_6867/g.17076  ORF Transcript_6867/g.17076 Transcript_6867/m.17076 type:complete len:102 (+) Transcript_6867:126-431(+)
MFEILEVCGLPGISGCLNTGQKVIDGHYPHMYPHSSSLSFWEKGMTQDMGRSFVIGHKALGNSTELGWEKSSQSVGSARKPNAALFQQFKREGKMRSWGSF